MAERSFAPTSVFISRTLEAPTSTPRGQIKAVRTVLNVMDGRVGNERRLIRPPGETDLTGVRVKKRYCIVVADIGSSGGSLFVSS
jgi:hypothetical protein